MSKEQIIYDGTPHAPGESYRILWSTMSTMAAKDAEIERLRRTMTDLRDELLAACLEASDYDSLYRRCMGLVASYEHAAEGGE